MTFTPKQFALDSSIELVADQFIAEQAKTELFRAASPNDRVNLAPGLITVGAGSQTILALDQGFIDEYEISFSPKDVSERIRGRDQSAKLLDTYVNIQFRRPPPIEAIETNPLAPLTDIRYGVFTARMIAEIIVAIAGLTISWEVRDYTLLETFSAQGRIIDVLRRLIEPWTLVTVFQADIYIKGSSIVVEYRTTPGAIRFTPNYVFDIGMARRTGLTVRRRRLRKYGFILLTGAKDAVGLVSTSTGLGGVSLSSGEDEYEELSEKFDDAGVLIERVHTKTTIRTPDRIPTKVIKSTYTRTDDGPLILTIRETIDQDIEPSIYDSSGPINQPKTLGKFTTREGIQDGDDTQLFRVIATEQLDYDYDDFGFLKMESSLKKLLNLEAAPVQLEKNELVTKTYREQGASLVNQIVEFYTFDSENQLWTLRQRDETLSGGRRPGGPNRALSTQGLGPGDAASDVFKNFQVSATISTDTDALPFAYQNPNLTLDDLNFLFSLFEQASGIDEFELLMNGIAIPWVKRGTIVQFTNLILEDGITTLTLPPAKITEVRLVYDESKQDAMFMMPTVRAFAWGSL